MWYHSLFELNSPQHSLQIPVYCLLKSCILKLHCWQRSGPKKCVCIFLFHHGIMPASIDPSHHVPSCNACCQSNASCKDKLHGGLLEHGHGNVPWADRVSLACWEGQKTLLAVLHSSCINLHFWGICIQRKPTSLCGIVWALAQVSFSIMHRQPSILGFLC